MSDEQARWERVMCPVLMTISEVIAAREEALETGAREVDWTSAKDLGPYDDLLTTWEFTVQRINGMQLYPEAPALHWQAAVDLNLAFIEAYGALSMERLGSSIGPPLRRLEELTTVYAELVDTDDVCGSDDVVMPGPAATSDGFEEFAMYINDESDVMRTLLDAIFLTDDRVDPEAMVAFDDYVELRIDWLVSRPAADCYFEAWDAHRRGAEHLHDWIMYLAARAQQANPGMGTRHIVSMDAATLDQLIPEALEGFASEMERVADFSAGADRPCG